SDMYSSAQNLVRLHLSNIALTDTTTGSPVTDYTLTVADAESSGEGWGHDAGHYEGQSVDTGGDGAVAYTVQPRGKKCMRQEGSGTELMDSRA
ncbi:hypothetical protein, partial [Salmonella enterica]|uniref:hypothetical protein n=1 Tax=Salmonella enterica TaxID=28901 RepID=UPI001E591032